MTEMAPFHELANVLPLLEGEEFQNWLPTSERMGCCCPLSNMRGRFLTAATPGTAVDDRAVRQREAGGRARGLGGVGQTAPRTGKGGGGVRPSKKERRQKTKQACGPGRIFCIACRPIAFAAFGEPLG